MGASAAIPSGAYIELLTQPDPRAVPALATGFGSRSQPLMILAGQARRRVRQAERKWSERVVSGRAWRRRGAARCTAAPVGREAWQLADPRARRVPPARRCCAPSSARRSAPPRSARSEVPRQSTARAGRAVHPGACGGNYAPVARANLLRRAPAREHDPPGELRAGFPGAGGQCCGARSHPSPRSGSSGTGGKASVWRHAGLLTVTEAIVIGMRRSRQRCAPGRAVRSRGSRSGWGASSSRPS